MAIVLRCCTLSLGHVDEGEASLWEVTTADVNFVVRLLRDQIGPKLQLSVRHLKTVLPGLRGLDNCLTAVLRIRYLFTRRYV
jgi:hypothetical protein